MTSTPHSIFVCGMSRSGTTLLATILDSHPGISMGYELLPANLPATTQAVTWLEQAVAAAGDDDRAVAEWLEAHTDAGTLVTFVKRCGRTLVAPSALIDILRGFAAAGDEALSSVAHRARLSMAVVERKMAHEGTSVGGFKINAPSIAAFHDVFPGGRFIGIVRDPRDVVASHFANDFDRTLEQIAEAWCGYTSRFLDFEKDHPGQALHVRYEDLVVRAGQARPKILASVGLEDCEEVERFYESKASVHDAGHRNATDLRRDLFASSIDRWVRDLDRKQIKKIEITCGPLMRRLGYAPAPLDKPQRIPKIVRLKFGRSLKTKKKFFRDDYGKLVLPETEGRVNLTWREAARGDQPDAKRILILRHDVDHDYETALRMAAWEKKHGLRATYCILHTAWYYGHPRDEEGTPRLGDPTYERAREMLDCCRKLQAMGHEINVHNNFVVVALKTGRDPVEMLVDELRFFALNGIEVAGTSTHGDRLCRDLKFRNYELFSESVYPERGGPRTVEYDGNRVELGAVSMSALGLEYEAYDLPRDYYITDSGGNLRVRHDTRGRAGRRRATIDPPPVHEHITGILTHPVWWDFTRDAPEPRELDIPREIYSELA